MTASWTEFSLTTTPELAESVADALHDLVEGGVVLEQLNDNSGSPDRWEYDAATGPVIVRGYLADDHSLEERKAKVEFALRCLSMVMVENGSAPLQKPIYKHTKREDWGESWKEQYKPMRIGRRVMIVPSWIDPATSGARADDVLLRLDPGQAFGTGLHPTTQLCVAALEQLVPQVLAANPAARMLDVGHGTAILGIVAAKLGVPHVLGVDIEDEAVVAGTENAALNGVSANVISKKGSWNAPCVRPPYDVVVANILAPVIIRLLGEGMGNVGRKFVFSGILDSQADDVIVAIGQAGLVFTGKAQMQDWVSLTAERTLVATQQALP